MKLQAHVDECDGSVLAAALLGQPLACLCRYLETAGRYNYTTPKSYLELIALYKNLLAKQREDLRAAKTRLENGVEKIAQASSQVKSPFLCQQNRQQGTTYGGDEQASVPA